jgi:hypothetical protein
LAAAQGDVLEPPPPPITPIAPRTAGGGSAGADAFGAAGGGIDDDAGTAETITAFFTSYLQFDLSACPTEGTCDAELEVLPEGTYMDGLLRVEAVFKRSLEPSSSCLDSKAPSKFSKDASVEVSFEPGTPP